MELKQVCIDSSSQAFMNVLDVGTGPVILFVHGFPLDHSSWRFQVEEFAKDYRVVCPDLTGFGKSPLVGEAMSMSGMVDDLIAMLDALGIDQPVCYCGLSMGGYVGWEFWKRNPERLSHLVACDTRAANDSEVVRRARGVSAKAVKANGTEVLAKEMVQKLLSKPFRSGEIADQVHDTIRATDPVSVAAGQLAMADRHDATGWLQEIAVPTLFLVGESDEITSPDEVKQNAGLVPGAVFVEIPNAGHLTPLENPVAFNKALGEFLKTR